MKASVLAIPLVLATACVVQPPVDASVRPAPLRAAVVVQKQADDRLPCLAVDASARKSRIPAGTLCEGLTNQAPISTRALAQAMRSANAFSGEVVALEAPADASNDSLRRLLLEANDKQCDVVVVVRGLQDGPIVETDNAGFFSVNSFLGGAILGAPFLWALPDMLVRVDARLVADAYLVPEDPNEATPEKLATAPIAIPEMAILPAERINGLWTGVGLVLVPYLLKTDPDSLRNSVAKKIPEMLSRSGLREWSQRHLLTSMRVEASIERRGKEFILRVKQKHGHAIHSVRFGNGTKFTEQRAYGPEWEHAVPATWPLRVEVREEDDSLSRFTFGAPPSS